MSLPRVEQKLKGLKVIAHKLYNPPCKADSFLSLVLAYRVKSAEYIVWVYNADSNSFANGFYSKSLPSAFKNFNNRGSV